MSRINKVILGAHAILANGGMFAITGSLLAATAARAHSTPVVVCSGQFKLTPQWNLYHEYGALDFADPSSVLGFEEGGLVDKVDVVNPYYDYVRPEMIDAYITNECVIPLSLRLFYSHTFAAVIIHHLPSTVLSKRHMTTKIMSCNSVHRLFMAMQLGITLLWCLVYQRMHLAASPRCLFFSSDACSLSGSPNASTCAHSGLYCCKSRGKHFKKNIPPPYNPAVTSARIAESVSRATILFPTAA